MKTVFITGIGGFLGRYVARHFASESWQVVGVDTLPAENVQLGAGISYHQLALPSIQLDSLLSALKPDVAIHCAGRASVPLSVEDPRADFHANVGLTMELLDALRRHSPACRTIFLSSAAVYGDPEIQPVSEEHRVAPVSPYGYHKRQGELLCEEFSKVYGMPTLSVRIFSAYGPGLRRQVIWDICQRALTTGKLVLHGTGHESRDFIHAQDIARALLLLAEQAPARGESYNLASGQETTIAHLAEGLIRELQCDVEPAFDGSVTPGQPINWCADLSRIRQLGFEPRITLDAGLRSIAQWARAELGLVE